MHSAEFLNGFPEESPLFQLNISNWISTENPNLYRLYDSDLTMLQNLSEKCPEKILRNDSASNK